MMEVLICLECGERVAHCQCLDNDPLVRWHQIQNKLVDLSKQLASNPGAVGLSAWKEIIKLGHELNKIEGIDTDTIEKVGMPEEIWVVDLIQGDDYRFRDCEILGSEKDAMDYIEAIQSKDQRFPRMYVFGGPWNITPDKIRTVDSALNRFEELYIDRDDDADGDAVEA